ncbi:hypothetical protein PQO03_08295 [Lentisphaera profundi]|uniref:Type II secretion system protein GspG C-terminal domain-containing protein n=1 Tax=Lentisphaera profundi TaxID=1658616 RepID=A0ABY7VQW7_9BACT|nr:hypothetical protein [Lentisphaera profundi]WDE95714.1 hypothetical protein PQO03_08295 [Lentisphaera profundi]
MAMVLPALGTAIKKVKECYIRKDLVQIRIALEIHCQQEGSYPQVLNDLSPNLFKELPQDPWTNYNENYHYNFEKNGLYSVGSNCLDDGGDIKTNRTLNSSSKDYGLYLNEDYK